jgi:hypothetical protein
VDVVEPTEHKVPNSREGFNERTVHLVFASWIVYHLFHTGPTITVTEDAMKSTIKPGIVLGVVVVAWMYIVGFTGWYKDPAMVNMFYLVILYQVGLLVWGLKVTAAEGRTYGQQIASGMMITIIGAAIIFVGSYLFTTIVFPAYFPEIRTMGEQVLRSQGRTEEDIRGLLDASAAMQTPFINAITGVVGTIVTGLFASLVIAVFVRKK